MKDLSKNKIQETWDLLNYIFLGDCDASQIQQLIMISGAEAMLEMWYVLS